MYRIGIGLHWAHISSAVLLVSPDRTFAAKQKIGTLS
jgi:hypothetical protein